MADKAIISFTVLWAEEIRAAAALLHAAHWHRDNKESTDEQRTKSLVDAINACSVALFNVGPGSVLVVCEGAAGKFVPRDITVTRAAKHDEQKEPRP